VGFVPPLKKEASLASASSEAGTGMPDDLFSNEKSQFGVNFGGSCNGKFRYIL
jgi:hypothetical protein